MNNYNLGKIAFVDRGIYDPEGTYNKWDFVTTQDSTYLCISLDPISGEHPTDDSFWKCIADGKPATLAAAAVNSSILSAGQLGSIKPTDAAPTPSRNGQYVFSIGGTKPAWLTAEAGITTVKAGDGVSVVYTAPSTYSYTHIKIDRIADIYNVTVEIPLAADQYYTPTTARAAIPAINRKKGLIITYEIAAGLWIEEQFIGTTTAIWTPETSWEKAAKPMTQMLSESTASMAIKDLTKFSIKGSSVNNGIGTIAPGFPTFQAITFIVDNDLIFYLSKSPGNEMHCLDQNFNRLGVCVSNGINELNYYKYTALSGTVYVRFAYGLSDQISLIGNDFYKNEKDKKIILSTLSKNGYFGFVGRTLNDASGSFAIDGNKKAVFSICKGATKYNQTGATSTIHQYDASLNWISALGIVKVFTTDINACYLASTTTTSGSIIFEETKTFSLLKEKLAFIFNANNIIESAKISGYSIGNDTGILQTSTTHFALFGIATKKILLTPDGHNQIHFYDSDFGYLGNTPANTDTVILNSFNAAYFGTAIPNGGNLKVISTTEDLQSQITTTQNALTMLSGGAELIEQTKEHPNYWLNSGEAGFPESIMETDTNRVATEIPTPSDSPFDVTVLPTIRKYAFILPTKDIKFMANIMADAPKITFMFWTKLSQLSAANCTTIRVYGKIAGVQSWRTITLPTVVGQEVKNNQDEEMRLKMTSKYGDWACFRLQWDNTVHTNWFMFAFNATVSGQLFLANVFLSKSIINIDALTVRFKSFYSTIPTLLNSFKASLTVPKSFLYGNEFFSICDSLGESGAWQAKLATLSGGTFSNSKNTDVTKPLSIGGTATIGQFENCGQWRARNFATTYPTAKVLFIENINDMGVSIGNISDKPFMLSRVDYLPDAGLTDLASANTYWTDNFATLVAGYTAKKGVVMNIPYYGSGKKLSITTLPTSNGNVTVVVNGLSYAIAVTTDDTIQTLKSKLLAYQYGLVTDSANIDGVSVDFYYTSGVTVTFNASTTGMAVTITDTTTAQIFAPRYFTGELSEWNNSAKWSSTSSSVYSSYRGLFEYLQNTLPNCELIFIIAPRYGLSLSSYLRADGTPDIDAFNASDSVYQNLCAAQKVACDFYNIRYVDLNKKGGITLYNLLTYYNENNVHPKQAGYDKWGEMIYKMLIG